MKSKSRVKYIDCIRALCMLWIVGCWHLINDYCNINIKTQLTTDITYGVLGTFVFISGYFIGKKEIHELKDVQNFIKSRLLRIYPLFFISCTSLYLMNILFQSETIVSLKQYLSTIFGLCMIITPAPSTVWFIGMIIIFYALTIPINMMNTLKGKVYVSAGLYIVMILLCVLANSDSRMLIYFPIYGAGLIMPRMKFSNEVKYALFIPSCLVFFVLSILRIGGARARQMSPVIC